MKKFFLIFGGFIAFLSLLSACQEEVQPDTGHVSESVKSALKVMSSLQKLDRMGLSSPSITNEKVGIKRQGSESGGRSRTTSDSLALEQPEWVTCARQEYVESGENYTWVLDYGEKGCTDGEYLMKGKMTETYTQKDGTFTSTIVYTNFGDNSYSMNGKTVYSGSHAWPENEEDSTAYSGFFEYSEDLQITFTEDGKTEKYTVVSSGRERYNEKGFTTEKEESKVQFDNGDFYERNVGKPLVYSFDCESNDDKPSEWIFTYVSGTESNTYKEQGEEGQFSIDYGIGTCDNIITITENGNTYTLDLGKDWEEQTNLF